MTLSSCYFCGTAIEEPLSEYPVVPDAFAPSPDEQGTVVLCPSCHRKLSRVMDHVVAAVDDRQRRFDPAGESGALDASTETRQATATSSDEATSTAEGSSTGEEPTDAATDSARSASGLDDEQSTIDVDEPPAIDEDAAEDLLQGGTSSGGVDETDESADVPSANDGITVDDGTGTTAEGAGDAADDGTDGGGAETSAGSSGAGSSAGGGGDGPPQATYNRVVRLLQNREFPVEREEIATVATNAYEIPPEDFDAVIETAVDRGVLVEEGQYLKQPE